MTKYPAVEENAETVICWVSEDNGFVFDIADMYETPTLMYSHAVESGERKATRPPNQVVETLRNDYGYTLK